MKLFEKLKNTFFEEEYVEVDEPKVEEKIEKKVEKKEDKKETKQEVKEEVAKKVEIKEEPKKEVYVDDIEDDTEEEVISNDTTFDDDEDTAEPIYSDREILSKNSKLSYFDEDDFVDEYYEEKKEVIKPAVEETKKIYGGSASSVYDSIINSESEHRPYGESSGKFHPTPIISPIYGVLDKNYRKEEVVDKKDRPSSYVSKRDMDLDSIRKKAYGDVSILDTAPEEEEVVDNEPLLYDMIDNETDSKPEVEKVTIADAEEYFEDLGLEYNVDYKDTSYEEATRSKSRSTRTEKHQDLDEDDKLSDTLTDLVVSDDVEEEAYKVDDTYEDDSYDDSDENLFDLVDSVYKGGEE